MLLADIEMKNGGAKRNRTADLLHAMQTLYQLSYSPVPLVERRIDRAMLRTQEGTDKKIAPSFSANIRGSASSCLPPARKNG